MEVDEVDEVEEEKRAGKSSSKKQVYIPGVSRELKENEEWEFDPRAYKMFHTFETTHPCLTFDPVIVGNANEKREAYPLTCHLVTGTQASKIRENQLLYLRLSNLTPIKEEKKDEEEDESDSGEDDEGESKEPRMHAAAIPHHGGVNRIRAENVGSSTVCAVWNDQGKVQLWNLNAALALVDQLEDTAQSQCLPASKEKPLFSFNGHPTEGFALNWSALTPGTLASGDNRGCIYLWRMGDGGQWSVDARALAGHSASVEDVHWSPDEAALLVSCSSDRSIRLWDTRVAPSQACVCTVADAHSSDVNVLSWNKLEPLLASGGDDGLIKIWSLKTIQYGAAVARFKYHQSAITSIAWNPAENTVLLASGEDDQTTIWDIAVEADSETATTKGEDLPAQLLFAHLGQHEVKEVNWHEQLPGVAITTALSGFNIFRTVNC